MFVACVFQRIGPLIQVIKLGGTELCVVFFFTKFLNFREVCSDGPLLGINISISTLFLGSSLARGSSILFIFSKNQFLVLLIFLY